MKRLVVLLLPVGLWVLAGCGEMATPSPTQESTPSDIAVQPTVETVFVTPTIEATISAPLQTVGGAASEYDQATIIEGQINFGIFCAQCHGPDARGLPNQGLDLTASQVLHKSTDEELLAFVIEGRSVDSPDNTTGVEMPPRAGFPNLEDDQILSMIAYLRSISE